MWFMDLIISTTLAMCIGKCLCVLCALLIRLSLVKLAIIYVVVTLFVCFRSVRAKHFLIHEDGIVKLSGLRTVVPMIEEGSRLKVSGMQ